MAKKATPFKSSVTKRAEKKEKALNESNRRSLGEMIKRNAQPIKLDKPFKRTWKINKSPIDPKKRKTL